MDRSVGQLADRGGKGTWNEEWEEPGSKESRTATKKLPKERANDDERGAWSSFVAHFLTLT